jgi:tripartite-type tricarboxylate transporter receptor subunit TctC
LCAPLLAALATLGMAAPAWAQTWPARPVTMVVPFGAGGPTDLVARVLGPALDGVWKQRVIIDNRPGAGGMLGTGEVSRAKPDGYTMLFQANGVTLAPLFQKNIPYDPADLRPIAGVSSQYYMIVTGATGTDKTLRDFIARAKEHPKQLNMASIPYTPLDLDIYRFMQTAGIDMTVINYNGTAALLPSVVRNDVHLTVTGLSTVLGLIKGGKLTALAYSGSKRTDLLPDVPTLREQGVNMTAGYTLGLWAPAKTPDDVVEKIVTGVISAEQTPQVAAVLREQGMETPDPRQFGQQIQAEQKVFTEIAQRIGLKPQ